VLAHLRCGDTYARVAAGFRIGIATVYRYIRETIDLLAALAPTLIDAVATAQAKAYVILDGTLLSIDRIAADRPYYSGKHKRHGMNVQVLADPLGRLIWVSPALPGAVHDLTAARTHGIISALATGQVRVWANKGYQGAGSTLTVPYRGRWSTLSLSKRAVNRAHTKIRALGDQANAVLKGWRLLRTTLLTESHHGPCAGDPHPSPERELRLETAQCSYHSHQALTSTAVQRPLARVAHAARPVQRGDARPIRQPASLRSVPTSTFDKLLPDPVFGRKRGVSTRDACERCC
jgi:hypothetical protein